MLNRYVEFFLDLTLQPDKTKINCCFDFFKTRIKPPGMNRKLSFPEQYSAFERFIITGLVINRVTIQHH